MPLLILGALVLYFVYDSMAHSYAVYDKKTGKRIGPITYSKPRKRRRRR